MSNATMAGEQQSPGGDVPERVRMIFDTTEEVRSVIHFRAWKDDIGVSEVINAALQAYLSGDFEEARRVKGGRPPRRKRS